MRRKSCFAMVALIVGLSAVVQADTLVGAGGSWQTWAAATLASTGGPYWNNASGDGANKNIGFCISGTGGCMLGAPGIVPYYGDGGSAINNLSFSGAGSPVLVSLVAVSTSQAGPPQGTDLFGWYSIGAGGTMGSLNYLWDSSAAPGATFASFTPGVNYGFFMESVQGKGTAFEADYFWFMNTGANFGQGTAVINPTYQKFAVFSPDAANTFYLGIEDSLPSGGDKDFNDMIVGVTITPEPGPGALLALGLAGCGFVMRRRRAAVVREWFHSALSGGRDASSSADIRRVRTQSDKRNVTTNR